MATETLIAPTQAGGSAIIDIRNNERVKVGTGGLLVGTDVVVEEWTTQYYQAAVEDGNAVVLNSDQTSGFLQGPGKYRVVLPTTSSDAHVYMSFGPDVLMNRT